jgi:hypothetical protein
LDNICKLNGLRNQLKSTGRLIEPSLEFILSLEVRKEERVSVKVEILFIPRIWVGTIEDWAAGMVIRRR